MIDLDQRTFSTRKQLPFLIVLGCLATVPGCSCSRDRDSAQSQAQEEKKETEDTTKSDVSKQAKESNQRESSSDSGSSEGSKTSEGSAGHSDSSAPESNSSSSTENQSGSSNSGNSKSNQAAGGFDSVPNGQRSSASEGTGERTSPAQALAKAEKLSDRAETYAGQGNYAKAYASSFEAWQTLQSHPGDKSCQAMSGELMAAMKLYGERTNKSNVQSIKDTSPKPLKVE